LSGLAALSFREASCAPRAASPPADHRTPPDLGHRRSA